MRFIRAGAFCAASAAAATLAIAGSAGAATPTMVPLAGSASPAAATSPTVAAVAATQKLSFEVDVALPDAAGAAAFAQAVSTPGSSLYKQYLTPAQWEARFSPSAATDAQVTNFLTQSGLKVTGVSADRMAVSVNATAAQVEQVFGTTLAYHKVGKRKLLLAGTDLSVPTSVAGVIGGVTGVSQTVYTPSDTTGALPVKQSTAKSGSTPAASAPAGFRNAPPCGTYYGAKIATTFPALPGGYPADTAYAPCGYTPPQIRSAYGLSGTGAGAGETVAVVDAYLSPTLYSDAATYAQKNDPANPLSPSKFEEVSAPTFNNGGACGGHTGWYGEQTLDVEAVHATAPGATILAAAAKNCAGGLLDTLREVVNQHLADVISNSYGDTGGDLLDSASERDAYENVLMMAAGVGITVTFSAGDDGDNFDQVGAVTPDFPATSPWTTAVGGTALQVGASGQDAGQYGWSTGKAIYCSMSYEALGGCTKAQLGTWSPEAYDYGGGGGTSYVFAQPSWQKRVVPASLSMAHSSSPMRVVPDISMDADPSTGFLVGETQIFPDGTYYDQYRIGGTSVSSPLFAGVVADANATAGTDLGFVDPALYSLSGSAISDIVSPSSPMDMIRSDYLDGVDNADGTYYSARTIDQQTGNETYCPPSGAACTTNPITLETSPGYDNMTGLGAPAPGFVQALATP